MNKDFIDGLKFAQVVCGWYEGASSKSVLVELDVQIFNAEHNGIENGAPICKKIKNLKIVNNPGAWLA